MLKLALLLAAVAHAQPVRFDAVVIHPIPPGSTFGRRSGCTGGPGTNQPARWTCVNVKLAYYIDQAFGLHSFERIGPAWLDEIRSDVTANVPDGADIPAFRQMQQHMLADRFGLKGHWEEREMPLYELTVAKNGPKLDSDPADIPDAATGPGPAGIPVGSDGYPVLWPGKQSAYYRVPSGKTIRRAYQQTMAQMAGELAGELGRPVVDRTGLEGKYNYTLRWISEPGMPPSGADDLLLGATLPRALQEQLGLKLESKKGPAKVLIIDRLEREPTAN